jgi:hemin uptake protein HemP
LPGEVAAFQQFVMDPPLQSAATPQSAPVATPIGQTQQREAWRSEELLGDRTEVLILHNGEAYRLRRTRQGKLILYK